jgi:hypothetical protein
MSTFLDLLTDDKRIPSSTRDRARPSLSQVVAKSTLHNWSPADPVPATGKRVLIGVAPWSGYDLRLLDILDQITSAVRGRVPHLAVFDVAECKSQQDFDRYIPSVSPVYQTPVVGIWENGDLKEKATGAVARNRVAQVFGITPEQLTWILTVPSHEHLA